MGDSTDQLLEQSLGVEATVNPTFKMLRKHHGKLGIAKCAHFQKLNLVSRSNMAQRELFASMPRRMDYSPWTNQESRQCNEKIQNLEDIMVKEMTNCLKLIEAIEVIIGKISTTKQGLQTKP